MPPSGLVFDFDGLILDTELPEFVTVREEFVRHGLDLRLEDWQHRLGRADLPHWIEQLEEELGSPIEREVVRARRLERHHALIHLEAVRPGVSALLDDAERLGVPAAVASSSSLEWVDGHLRRLGLRERFVDVVTRERVAHAKPWPDLYLEAVDALGADPATTVAFEDSHNGCAAAKAAGLWCVVVPNEVSRAQDFSAADRVTASLADVDLAVLPEDLRRDVGISRSS